MINSVKIYDRASNQARDVSIKEFSLDLNKERNFVLLPNSKVTVGMEGEDLREVIGGEAYAYLRNGYEVYDEHYLKAKQRSESNSGFTQGAISGISMDLNTLLDDDEDRATRVLTKQNNKLTHKLGYGAGLVTGLVGTGGSGAFAKAGVLGAKTIAKGSNLAFTLGMKTGAGRNIFKLAQTAANSINKLSPSFKNKVAQGIGAIAKNKRTVLAGKTIQKGVSTAFKSNPVAIASKLGTKAQLVVAKKTGNKFLAARASDITFGAMYGIAPAIEEKDPFLVAENSLFTGVAGGVLGITGTAIKKTFVSSFNLGGKVFPEGGSILPRTVKNSYERGTFNISSDKQAYAFKKSINVNLNKYISNLDNVSANSILNKAGIKKSQLGKLDQNQSVSLAAEILAQNRKFYDKRFSKNRGDMVKEMDTMLEVSGSEMNTIKNAVAKTSSNTKLQDLSKFIFSTLRVSKDKRAFDFYNKKSKLQGTLFSEAKKYILNQYRGKKNNFSFVKVDKFLKKNNIDRSDIVDIGLDAKEQIKKEGLNISKILNDNQIFKSLLSKKSFGGPISLNEETLGRVIVKNHKLTFGEIKSTIQGFEGKAKVLYEASPSKIKSESVKYLEIIGGKLRDLEEKELGKVLKPDAYKKFLLEKGRYGSLKTMKDNILLNPVKSESAFFTRDMLTLGAATIGIGGLVGASVGAVSGATVGFGLGLLNFYMSKSGKGLLTARGVTQTAEKWLQGLPASINKKSLAFKNLSNAESYKNFKPTGRALRGMTYEQIGETLLGNSPESPEEFQRALLDSVNEYDTKSVGGVQQVVKQFLNEAGVNDDKLNAFIDYKTHKLMQVTLQNVLDAFKGSPYASHPRIKKSQKQFDIRKKKFEQNMSVVFSPESVSAYIRESKLTPRMIENFKAVFPDKYEEMQQRLLMAYKSGQLNLTRKQTMTLSRFIGYDLIGTKGVTSDSKDGTSSIKAPERIQRKIKEGEGQQTAVQRVETL